MLSFLITGYLAIGLLYGALMWVQRPYEQALGLTRTHDVRHLGLALGAVLVWPVAALMLINEWHNVLRAERHFRRKHREQVARLLNDFYER